MRGLYWLSLAVRWKWSKLGTEWKSETELLKGGPREKGTREKQKCRLSPEGGLAFHDAAVSKKLQEKCERGLQKEKKRYWVFYEKFISEWEERWHWRVWIHEAEGRKWKWWEQRAERKGSLKTPHLQLTCIKHAMWFGACKLPVNHLWDQVDQAISCGRNKNWSKWTECKV